MSITYYRTRFTGAPVAQCDQCGTVFPLYEDESDLVHDCPGQAETM